jgi:pimeloyl-ACP methyl ester carboxylesterase
MQVNNVELCVDTVGNPGDPAILLIAGMASSMDWWHDGFVDRLAAGGRHVIRYDTRDTGQSQSYPPGEPGYTAADLVEDAIGVLDALGVASAQFVGISMGGAVAQLAAIGHPDRVDSLVLIATSPVNPGAQDLPPMSDELRDYFMGRPAPDYTDRNAMVAHGVDVQRHLSGPRYFDEDQVSETAGRVFDRTRNMASSEINHTRMGGDNEPSRPRLGDITAPTLVFHGTVDPMFALPHGEALARQIPDAMLLPLDGVGHQPPPPATWDIVVPRMLAIGAGRIR